MATKTKSKESTMDSTKKKKSMAFEQALRALDTLEHIDLVLAPKRATPDMLVKASKATGLPIDILDEVYVMMIDKSQEL